MNQCDVAISTNSTNAVDCIMLAIVHDAFKDTTLDEPKRITNANPLPIDVRGSLDEQEAKEKGIQYRTL
jgi:UDP-N-acetyl-D-mannosaminuronate dehydrogenase